jgi:nicotinate-nucleotide adenylyltransferase
MRVAVFGGTFDPVHLGHLIVAEQCREQAKLDEVWFVPAARPPHKQREDLTPFDKRVEMLELAIAGQPAFRVNEIESQRPGPSYTVDTLEELARQTAADWFLILGSDGLADFPSWHRPQRIMELATVLAVARPGFDLPAGSVPARMQTVAAPLMDISSRDIRRRAAEGRSLRYLVPRAVECYIETHRPYRR